MKIDIEQLKKKIIYRSTYRGTKEMDKILGSFIKKYINELDVQDLLDLEKLIEVDDDNLYNFYNKLNTKIKVVTKRINAVQIHL